MIFDLTTYQFIWWVLVGIVLIIFCVTAGFDLGVGMLLCWVGRTNDERRVLLNVIGPNWDGNQVWLIIAGVALFGVWPRAYAVAFTGFYGGLMLMLWSLYLRPTGFEWRSKINCSRWRTLWDWGIFIGSFMPAFAPGLLFGNILQGLDFQFDNEMRFQFIGHVEQLFNPFAICSGLMSAFLLLSHGGSYLQLRTEGEIKARCARVTQFAAVCFLVLLLVVMIWLRFGIVGFQLGNAGGLDNPFDNTVIPLVGAWYANYAHHVLMWLAPLIAFMGGWLILYGSTRKAPLSFLGSVLSIIGVIASYGFGTFPFMLPSKTHPTMSLTTWNASSGHYTLQIIFIVALIMIPTIICYTLWIYKKLWGKVTLKDVKKNEHTFY